MFRRLNEQGALNRLNTNPVGEVEATLRTKFNCTRQGKPVLFQVNVKTLGRSEATMTELQDGQRMVEKANAWINTQDNR